VIAAAGCSGYKRRTCGGSTSTTTAAATSDRGRFKAFPVEDDEHLLAVLRYVERNPLRSGLVSAVDG